MPAIRLRTSEPYQSRCCEAIPRLRYTTTLPIALFFIKLKNILTLDICRDMIYIVRRHSERRYSIYYRRIAKQKEDEYGK